MGFFDFWYQPHFWWGWMFFGLGAVFAFPLAYGIRRARLNKQLLRSRIVGSESKRLISKEIQHKHGVEQRLPASISPLSRPRGRRFFRFFINSRGSLGYGGIILWLFVVMITGFTGIFVWWSQNQIEFVRAFELSRDMILGSNSAEGFFWAIWTMISKYGWGFPVFFGLAGMVWSMGRWKLKIMGICCYVIVIFAVLFMMDNVLDLQKDSSFQIFRTNGSDAFFLIIPEWNGEEVMYGSVTMELVQGSPWLGFFGFKRWILTDFVQYGGEVVVENRGNYSHYRIEPMKDREYSLATDGEALFDSFYRLLLRNSFFSHPTRYDLGMTEIMASPGVVLGLSEGFLSIIFTDTVR